MQPKKIVGTFSRALFPLIAAAGVYQVVQISRNPLPELSDDVVSLDDSKRLPGASVPFIPAASSARAALSSPSGEGPPPSDFRDAPAFLAPDKAISRTDAPAEENSGWPQENQEDAAGDVFLGGRESRGKPLEMRQGTRARRSRSKILGAAGKTRTRWTKFVEGRRAPSQKSKAFSGLPRGRTLLGPHSISKQEGRSSRRRRTVRGGSLAKNSALNRANSGPERGLNTRRSSRQKQKRRRARESSASRKKRGRRNFKRSAKRAKPGRVRRTIGRRGRRGDKKDAAQARHALRGKGPKRKHFLRFKKMAAARGRRRTSAKNSHPLDSQRGGAKKALLTGMLGRSPLKPPSAVRGIPTRNPWNEPLPSRLSPELGIQTTGLRESEIESVRPPSLVGGLKISDGKWIREGKTAYYHQGEYWGRLQKGKWSWLDKSGGQWWLWSAPGKPPVLWSKNHWWAQSNGLWFLLHNGEAWGYQYLNNWSQEGFRNESGTQIVYSKDGSRVLVSTPKEGAALFDAQTGAQLGQWRPEAVPRRPHPHLPSPTSISFD